MAQYRKVDTCIWNDEKFSKLSDRAKLAFLLILTHPNMTSFGCMRATVGGLAAELGWLSEGYQEGYREPFEELLSLGLVVVDDKAAFFAVPNFLKYNRPDGPKVVIGWGKLLYLLPECRSKYLYFQRVRETLKGYGIGLEKALPKGFSNTQNSELRTHSSELREENTTSASADVCTETPGSASSVPPEIVLTFPTDGKPRQWSLTQTKLDEYRESFPSLDVLAECRNARQWILDNATRRKTATGMPKFLGGWLGRAQNRQRGSPQFATSGARGVDIDAIDLEGDL